MVLAFEPQRIVFQTLVRQSGSEQHSQCRCACSRPSAPKAASIKVPTLDYRRENNFGGLALGTYEVGERVPVVTIDSFNLQRCNFIKVDVEGMETDVLRGAATHNRAIQADLVRRERQARTKPTELVRVHRFDRL